MLVRDLMSPDPVTISPDAHLGQALELMGLRKVRHLVVVNEDGKVVGILSDRDLAMYYDPVQMTQERWAATMVKELMTRNPKSIGSGAGIESAARMLVDSGFSGLPVIDSGLLIGFLSDKDFVRSFLPRKK
jgi:acetoin utilization protein AcuB